LAEFEVVRYKAIVKEKFQARIPKNRISTTTRDTSRPNRALSLSNHQRVFTRSLVLDETD
jgi:hypothetical protein